MLLQSIRSRLIGLVAATVVPFAALIGIGIWSQWRTEQASALERAHFEARMTAATVDDHIGNLHNLLSGVAFAVSWDPRFTATNDLLLRRVKADLPDHIANILLFSPDGKNIGTSSDAGRITAEDRQYFKDILAGKPISVSEPLRSRAGREWVVVVARGVEDNEGNVRAVLIAGTRLEHFQSALGLSRLPKGSVVRILDQNNRVVAHSLDPANWVGQTLGQDSLHVQPKPDGTGKVIRWPDDVERITGTMQASLVPWVISVGLPADSAFATVRERLAWSSLFTLITVLIAFGIAWAFSGRVARPLRQLGRDAAALAAGDLGHRSHVSADDEVGGLADAFNRMASSLQARESDLMQSAEELRRANNTLEAVIDASPVAIVCSDLDRKIFIWSRTAEQMFGYTAEEANGKFAHAIPPKGDLHSQGLFERAARGEILRDLRLKRLHKNGRLIDVRAAAAPMYNPDGTIRGVARAYEDITDFVRAEEQLNRVAHFDQLTGLPNRLSLQKELDQRFSEPGRPTAIALFDLDGFKDVNDTLGHSVGDKLLVNIGQRLARIAGGRGQVCRLGGDEFVVVVPGCGNPIEMRQIVDEMLTGIADPIRIGDHVLHVHGSAGIAIAPTDADNADDLLANADLALYQAKADGGRTSRVYLPILRAQAQARRSLDLELRRAYAENEFELYFQPQIRLIDGALVGAEALLRWRHPVAGILAPGAFIDTLATSAIAPDVSRWILQTACARAQQWRQQGLWLGRVGVNLFPNQVGDKGLLADIDDALQKTGLPASALELEITENVALNMSDADCLQQIADRGVQIAFDDFGTGFASLSYLTRFPLSRIKIDRSFVGNITEDASDAAIVRSLIAMAHNLGLGVIAEGVETQAQADFLIKENCGEAQGYLYAKPLPAADFEALLRTHRLADAPARTAHSQARKKSHRRLRAS